MGRNTDSDVHAAFVEFRAKDDDKCLSVQCIYCREIRAKNTTRQKQHLLECTGLQQAAPTSNQQIPRGQPLSGVLIPLSVPLQNNAVRTGQKRPRSSTIDHTPDTTEEDDEDEDEQDALRHSNSVGYMPTNVISPASTVLHNTSNVLNSQARSQYPPPPQNNTTQLPRPFPPPLQQSAGASSYFQTPSRPTPPGSTAKSRTGPKPSSAPFSSQAGSQYTNPTLPPPPLEDIHAAFVEFRANDSDKCLSVQCIYCNQIRAKNTSRQREHLVTCSTYLSVMRDRIPANNLLHRFDEHDIARSLVLPIPKLELDFRISLKLNPKLTIGAPVPGGGSRSWNAFIAGSWAGRWAKGIVIPGGQDLQVTHKDLSTSVDARFLLQTADDPPVYISCAMKGWFTGSREVMERMYGISGPPVVANNRGSKGPVGVLTGGANGDGAAAARENGVGSRGKANSRSDQRNEDDEDEEDEDEDADADVDVDEDGHNPAATTPSVSSRNKPSNQNITTNSSVNHTRQDSAHPSSQHHQQPNQPTLLTDLQAQAAERRNAPNTIAASDYRFRVTFELESGDERYTFLNQGVWLGSGSKRVAEMVVDAYRVS